MLSKLELLKHSNKHGLCYPLNVKVPFPSNRNSIRWNKKQELYYILYCQYSNMLSKLELLKHQLIRY
ncbi:hypothetical protein Glove_283g120 [Diversispora epigaea]|uniref:Uncharacterized protein n=1 Tax=Diversispora epigaea TaxID=1348612 RepID=A0A397I1N9_9GLOM|nr:hypothetical protein Glove_283g120 [Diversispora epigaea]